MMTMSNFFIPTFYFISILLFFNYTSPFIFWVMTELNLFMFIMLMIFFLSNKFKQELHDLVLFYFVIQSMASIFLLSNFVFSESVFIFNSDIMFIVSILLKLGIFPFFFWIFKISEFLNHMTFSFLLTFQKVPFFMALFSFSNSLISFFLLGSFIFGSFLIFFSKSFVFMLVASSISSSFWLFFLYAFDISLFFLFFLFYSIFIFGILKLYFSCPNSSFSFSLIFFMFLFGLPPLSLFFFKFLVSSFFFMDYKSFEFLLFWFLSFFSLFGYMKYFFKSAYSGVALYINSFNYKIKIISFGVSWLFFSVFFA